MKGIRPQIGGRTRVEREPLVRRRSRQGARPVHAVRRL